MARTDQGTGQSSRATSGTTSGRSGAAGQDAAELVSEAVSLLESFVASFEPGRYSGEGAAVLVERFSRGEHLCATGKALAAKRATETELHRTEGHRSAAEWLSRKTGDSIGAAAGSLSLADGMERHGELADALRTGELSPSRAQKVADALSVSPGSEDELVEAAKDRTETNRQLGDRCLRAKARARSAEEAHEHDERIRKARYLRHSTDQDGAFRLEALLTPHAGAKLLAALRPTRTALFDEARRQGVRERPEAYEADALVALVTGERQRPPTPVPVPVPVPGDSGAGPAGSGPAGSGSAGSGSAGSSTGSSSPAGSSKAGSGSSPAGSSTAGSGQDITGWQPIDCPPPASVHLRVELEALRRGWVEGTECCEIPGVGPVPLATARSVLGDAIVHLIITKGTDIATVANLGRTIRAPLRRALIERDQTCVVPGCDVREGLEIDHRIIPVVEGGPAALWNTARLCPRHHRLRHHQGFRLEGGPGDWQWLPPERPPPGRTDDEEHGDDDDRLFRLE